MYYSQPSKMLETKAVIYGLFYLLGIPATILGILANIGTWKADILFFLSAILLALKIVVYIIERNQVRQDKEMDLEKKRHELKKWKNRG